jgi:hypothetical protein
VDKFRFENIDTLLIDPDRSTRDSVRMIREFRLGETLSDVSEQFAIRMPDLLICEADLAEGDFCEFVRGLRHHNVGTNPFLPVMTLSYNPTPELVRKSSIRAPTI